MQKISKNFSNSKKNLKEFPIRKKIFKILKNFQNKFEESKKFPEIFLRNSGNSKKFFRKILNAHF